MSGNCDAGILKSYSGEPDNAYSWEVSSRGEFSGSEVVNVDLQSQKWKGSVWKHRLKLLLPRAPDTDHVLLFITGSGTGLEELAFCKILSDSMNLPCAVFLDVPNQPLFNGLYEDEVIALTFSKFIETEDEEWPLLLPMVKSARRAMDALEELLEESSQRPKGFIVMGASKRGWTTWLASAVDERVVGIAPLVFDNLNLPMQMRHQVECYGSYSEMISDYTERGLQQKMGTEAVTRLVQIVDPYSYRDVITVPKMIVNGTNDRYWTVDSLNLYYDDLLGEKRVLYVPNSGHGLEDRRRVINSITAFVSSIVKGERLPEVKIDSPNEDLFTFKATTSDSPLYVDLWKATSSTMDFRDSRWESFPGMDENDHFAFRLAEEKGFTALFAEASFMREERIFSLSSKMSVLRPAK